MMRWWLWCCGCWRCGSCCEGGCGSRSGTRLQDREVACGLSGDSGNNKRGHLRREGLEIVIGMVIALSFRKGLRSSNEICRVIEAA
jgi:hypothetical protein